MFWFSGLLCVCALTLSVYGSSSGNNRYYDLSGSDLTEVYNSPVYMAAWMERPKGGSFGLLTHSGVRVTLGDGRQFLIHKGKGAGVSSETVVVDARHMSNRWETVAYKNFHGTKTVSDFVHQGGPDYNLLWDNCHFGSIRMMGQ